MGFSQSLSFFKSAAHFYTRKDFPDLIHFKPPSPLQIKKLDQEKNNTLLKMQEKYPQLYQRTFHGEIAYTLRRESLWTMLENGGFKAKKRDLYWANPEEGNNTGAICFTLLPQVASLFFNKAAHFGSDPSRSIYIFAFPLHGDFLCPGGHWRQIIAPGAFPLPSSWVARKVIAMDEHKRHLKLGPWFGTLSKAMEVTDQESFAYFRRPILKQPEIFDYGSEDYPMRFAIQDTPASAKFHQDQLRHYHLENPINRLRP